MLCLLIAGALAACGGDGGAVRAGAGCAQLSSSATCGVLFVGNSHTATNDLPAVFAALAKSGGRRVTTGMVAPGGWTLARHAAGPHTLSAIRDDAWNVVVLQEQSQLPAAEDLRQTETLPAARALTTAIRDEHAQPLLFLTWARQAGWPEQGLRGYGLMQMAVTNGYQRLGQELGTPVAPIGAAWSQALTTVPGIGLWDGDGNHPSQSGTYLAACVFYATIFRSSPAGLTFHGGLSPATASALQGAASGVVLGTPARWGLDAVPPQIGAA